MSARWQRMCMDDRRLGNCLLASQAACELAYLLPGRRLWRSRSAFAATGSALITGGVLLGLGGALTLGRQIRLHPIPPAGAVLRTGGPYGLVRHPIYVGMLSTAAGVTLLRGSQASVLAWTAMVFVLSTKATLEEHAMLSRCGGQYRRYSRAVVRGLPPTPWIRRPLESGAAVAQGQQRTS
jgi:protein-S-isoprenylcysteine O-methyltransferase Ste14